MSIEDEIPAGQSKVDYFEHVAPPQLMRLGWASGFRSG